MPKYLILAIILALLATNCRKSQIKTEELTEISVDTLDIVLTSAANSSGYFNITASGDWVIKVSENIDWLKINPETGTGDKFVTVSSLTANKLDSQRSVQLLITPASPSSVPAIIVNVSQLPEEKVDTSRNAFGSTGFEIFMSVVNTDDGGLLAVGATDTKNNGDVQGGHGGEDIWIVKLDAKNQFQWQKCIGGVGRDYASKIIKGNDGNFVLVGTTDGSVTPDAGNSHGSSDICIIKINPIGNVIWSKIYGGAGVDDGSSIAQCKDGGYVVIGTIQAVGDNVSTAYGKTDVWVVRIDEQGEIVWEKTFGGSSNDELGDIASTPDGSFLIAGTTNNIDHSFSDRKTSDGRIFVLNINSSGTEIRKKFLGGKNVGLLPYIISTQDSGYAVSCDNTEVIPSNPRIFKVDKNNNLAWEQNLTFGNLLIGKGLCETKNRNIVLSCARYTDNYHISVVSLHSSGKLLWQKDFAGLSHDEPKNVVERRPGNYSVIGYSDSKGGDIKGGHGSADGVILSFSK